MRQDTEKVRRAPRQSAGLARALVVCIAAAGLSLTGCGPLTQQRLNVSLPEPATPIAVDVVNEHGSVEVRANPRLKAPRVEANIRWTNAIDEDEAAELAASVSVESSMEESPGGAVLRVRARDIVDDLPEHRVHLRIALPRVDGVRVISTGGDVVLAGVAGAVHVENAVGAIELRTDKPVNAPVALLAGRGNVYFQAPVGSQGAFDLRTERGRVGFDSKIVWLEGMRATPTTITGALAGGANPITLRSETGDVRAWVMEAPMALVRVFR